MTVIQNSGHKGEEELEDDIHHQTVITSSPLDSAVIQITELNDSNNQDISQTNVPDEEGHALKQHAIWKQVQRLHRKVYFQIGMALLRNILCWTCVVSLVVLLSEAANLKNWSSVAIVLVVVLFSTGALAIGFHAHRAYNDLTFQKPTLVMSMLRDAVTREEFNRKIQNLELSAPELFTEVSLKSGAMSYEDPNHWTRSPGRKTMKELTYRGWADQSKGTHTIPWPQDGAGWIIVAKDFRCVDKETHNSIEREAADFKRDTDFVKNHYYMNFDYILQWKEADSSPDAEVYLVLSDERSSLYNVDLYRAAMLLSLDSIYRIIFHLYTKSMTDYYIIKFIER